jgi:hypothetical protein
MKQAPRRTLLGARRGFGGQQRVYRAADCLEIDHVEGFEVARRRIFYDEVLLVTMHAFYGWAFLLACGFAAAMVTLVAIALSRAEALAGGIVFLAVALPFIVLLVLRLAVPAQAVTVFGKRARADMVFWPRPGRARDVYLSICRLARDRQARVAREQGIQRRAAAPASPPAAPGSAPAAPSGR